MTLYDLTNMQKSIWFSEEFFKGTPISNITGTALINEKIDFKLLSSAINLFLQNNDSFKIKVTISSGTPKQYFDNIPSLNFDIIDISSEKDLRKLENTIVSEPFDIIDSFLFKFVFFKFPDGHGGFVVNMHHLISDAWTSGLLVSEIMDLYSSLIKNNTFCKDNMPSYLDYILSEQEYLKSSKFENDKTFWNNLFKTIPEVALIPGLANCDNKLSAVAKRKLFTIPKSTMNLINDFCKNNKISAFNFFMGIFAIYLGRVSNLDDFVIGTPVLNRSNFKEKHTTGMFVNVVPCRITLNHTLSFSDFVKQLSANFFSIFKHQKYSYQLLLEDLRKVNPNIPSLYSLAISYQNMRSNKQISETNYESRWSFNKHISEDLDIHFFDIDDTGDINIAYDYRISKYNIDDIFALHARILHMINQILGNPSILLSEIEIVTPNEKNEILYKFNNTKMDYPKDKTIVKLFEEQVSKSPDNIAIVFENKELTYREFNEKVNCLANYLLEIGLKENDIVGIMLNRSLEMIISIFAVLKAGGTFLIIDNTLPFDRIIYMLQNSKSSLLIYDSSVKSVEYNSLDINILSTLSKKENPSISNAENLSIIYTSGSTGNPKGILIKRNSMVNLIWSFIYSLQANKYNNFLSICNVSFDMFSVECFVPLILGKKLFLANDEEQKNPIYMSNLIVKNKIEYMLSTPSKLELLFSNDLFSETLRHVKVLQIGGENPSFAFLKKLTKSTNAKVYNSYGPSETTSCCSLKEITDISNVTIGKPLSNMQMYILNKDLHLCPVGVTGEIFISGNGVSKGYIGNDELTKKAFIPSPFDENALLYKTGDLGYFTNDYEIKFIGREDFQVKIRGLRIELDEINNIIQSFPSIKKAITIYNKYLITFITATTNVDILKLKNYIKSKLPNYMIPFQIQQLSEFPLSSNGKIDVKKLAEIKITSAAKNIVSASTDTEKKLFNIFSKLLDEVNISINDNFFDLGGDSLSAIKLSVEIYDSFNKTITVKDIFANSSIKELAKLLDKYETKETIVMEKTKNNNFYPLSSAQKRVYISSNMSGNNSVLYNTAGGILLNGKLDIKKLEKCFETIINRHDSLRTYFEVENDTVVQKIRDKVDFKLEIATEKVEENAINTVFRDFLKPFDLSKAPLFRAKLVPISRSKNILFVDMHHIISDGTSFFILIDELCKLYNNEALEELNMTYKDFAVWESNKLSSGGFKEAEDFWVNQFKSGIPVLNMPTNYSRPAIKSYEGAKVYAKLNQEITSKINNICKELNCTPYMLLLSIYYVLLSKYTSQDDIIVGSPIVGRNISNLYNVIGMFVNSLPMRAHIDSNLTFKDFLNTVKNICLENYKYQDYPFDELVNKLNIPRDTSRNPLFDTMFIYQNNGNKLINFNGIQTTYYIPDSKISKFDLTLEIVPENDILNLSFEYCTKLFNKQFIENLSNHYSNILNVVLYNINIQISDICMLSSQEQNKILYEFNNTKMDYPKDKTISQLFEEQVEKTPNNIALVFEDQKLTYNELNKKANSLAYYLREQGIGRNDTVGIMVNRSLEMIIAILAVLKSGGCYIPIDPEYPQDRIEYMLNNSSSKLLLTKTHLEDNINFDNKVCVDLNNYNIYDKNVDNLENINQPDDLSYIIYTSGSTGLPKGVMLKNISVINFIYATINVLGLKDAKTILAITTISFDIFVLESLLPLLNGMQIIIASEKVQTDIVLLNLLCEKNNVDIIQTTPSRMQALLFDESTSTFAQNLKYILIGGEAFPEQLLNKLHTFCNAKIYNMYGPTETTVWSSIKDLSATENITIGKPIGNTQMYILDKFRHPLPVDVPGELFISGDGVCAGYFNNIDLSREVFISNPFIQDSVMYKTGDLCKLKSNGEIDYLGRIDNQVKIRGLRIELGEIENKILLYPNIQKVCVIKQTMNNRDFISAYFTVSKRVSISELRKYLSSYLPKYMVPSYFTVLEDFPYTPNGKIDKKSLPLPKEILNTDSIQNYIAPKTALEKQFVSIWENILNTKPIGINDNFFELGGDSILAMNLHIELRKFIDKISYADIFKFPTISALIEKLNSKNENYDFEYMKKNYDKYSKLLELNSKVPSKFNLKYTFPQNLLLTGATGFLGIHILEHFIKTEKGIVYCIVREEPGLTAQTKLYQKLNYYFGNKYNKLIGKRIFAIKGDICKPDFGLNQEDLLNLASNINIVINTAARVAHYGNYSDFYKVNVQSVNYLINFCKSFNKKLYHVSTLSVSGNSFDSSSVKQDLQEITYFKENNLYIGQSLENVYIRSKFEAECLVLDAILDGLDAYILRVGNLMPRFKDGVFQENILENAFINRVLSFIKIGMIPQYLEKEYLEFTPVDNISDAILKIITHPNKNFRIFHLFNHNHIYIEKCLKYFKMLNSNFKICSEEEFTKKLESILNSKKNKNLLNSLINDLDKDLHLMYTTNIIIKSENTIKYLSKIGFSWQKIGDKYMIKFSDLLRKVM